jgi:hypothetical protein
MPSHINVNHAQVTEFVIKMHLYVKAVYWTAWEGMISFGLSKN